MITNVENIKHLKALRFLDLAENKIQNIVVDEFPANLEILIISKNPFINV